MNYYSVSLIGGNSVLFFNRKKRLVAEAKKEAQIQSIRKDIFKTVNRANKSMDKLTNLIDDTDLGVTGKIFYATGGDKRNERS